jgi:hypothetical protein
VPLEIVRAAFGQTTLSKPMGLYSVACSPNVAVAMADAISFASLSVEATQQLVGGIFTFRGFRFAVYFSSDPLPANLTLNGAQMPEWNDGTTHYRTRRHRWKIGKHISHYIDFTWPAAGDTSFVHCRTSRA